MLSHYFKLIWRNLLRQRFFAVLNLMGLALGIAVCIVVYQYIQDELQYDQFHQHKNRLYRINQTAIWGDEEAPFASTGPNVALAIEEAIPEVEAVTRIHTPGQMWGSYEGSSLPLSFQENHILAADSNVFSLFTTEFISGDKDHALHAPYSVVMTASTARRYFGDTPALGKVVSLRQNNETNAYQVTGVVQDWPSHSHFHFDMLLSMTSFPRVEKMGWSWIWTTFVTYALLQEGTSYEAFAAQLQKLPETYAVPTLQRVMGVTYEQFTAEGKSWELFAQPLTHIRLYSGKTYNRLGPEGDIKIVYALSIIALLVLILSSINYMNLATASATRRAKEVGLQKVLGSTRVHLARFFYTESILYCLMALVIALVAVQAALPYFNAIAAKNLTLHLNWKLWGWIGFAVLLGLAAGWYPALYLSSFRPVSILSGNLTRGKRSMRFRNTLVIVQFTISSLLIMSTLIVADQLNYLRNKDLGFDKDHVIVIPHAEQLGTSAEVFRSELIRNPQISSVSMSNSSPPAIHMEDYFVPDGKSEIKLPISYMEVESGYINTLGIPLLAGRDFLPYHEADKHHIILNETAVKRLGWIEDQQTPNYQEIIGNKLIYPGQTQAFEVIGVMQDIHYHSLQVPIEPLALFYTDSPIFVNDERFISVKLEPESASYQSITATIEQTGNLWEQTGTVIPFEYSFLDDDFFAAFQAEQQLQSVLSLLTSLAIIIACLGLLGLIAYTVERRNKEMSIRKVLGATMGHVYKLLSWDLLRWVAIGFSISIPVAYFVMQQWLGTFAYRMTLSWEPFVWTAVLLTLVAVLTISYHSLQTARANPVKSLKNE